MMRFCLPLGLLCVSPLLSISVSTVLAQDTIVEQVLMKNDPAPGLPGITIDYIMPPAIDGEGKVLMVVFLEGPGIDGTNDNALYYGFPGELELVLRDGDPAPGMEEGVVLAEILFGAPSISEAGWISKTVRVAGPGIIEDVNDEVFYAGPPGDLQKVLQLGDPAPGCEPGQVLVTRVGGRLSDNGTLLVSSEVPGTFMDPDEAWWIGTRDNLELVYRDYMHPPGTYPYVSFRGLTDLSHNDNGEICFAGYTDGSAPDRTIRHNKWIGGPGTLQFVSYDNVQVQDMDPGITWDFCCVGEGPTNVHGDLSDAGYIQGPGVTEDNNYVLLMGNKDAMHLVARKGDLTPEAGPGVYINDFGHRYINNRKEMFFEINYAGEGISDENRNAAYFGTYGAFSLELREGNPAPGCGTGITLEQVSWSTLFVAMNDVGDVITTTKLQGPGITEDNDHVLWLRHRILERWIPLLQSGEMIGDKAIYCDDIELFGNGYNYGTGGGDGRRQSFNDLGMLAIWLRFTDGSSGVFRVQSPVFGDADADLDVDFGDWQLMADCCDEPGEEGCSLFDLDEDGDVDMHDIAMFQQLFTGP